MLKRISVLLSSLIVAACGLTGGSAPVATPSKPAPVIGLALGGGASKGFAHIGVIKVLQEAGIPIKVVTGTSAGAVVGSMYASGMSPDRLELEAEIMNKADVIDFALSFKGLIKGEKLAQYINVKTKQQLMQNYPIKFGAVATDFSSGKMVVFNKGKAGQAVRASASIPNVFQPATISGRQYVDGGLVAPVPVTAAQQLGATLVIAVDITARPSKNKSDGFWSYLDQSLNIMSTTALNHELAKADVVIRPNVLSMGAVSGFDQKKEAIEQGEKAARAALPKIRALLAK